MELGEVRLPRMPVRSAGLAQQAGFALGLGAWMTLAMWVVARVPWAGVFGLGTVLGWVLLDYWLVLEAEGECRGEVAELEKQVVSLRTVLGRMMCPTKCSNDDAHGRARAEFRAQRHSESEHDLREALLAQSSGMSRPVSC